MKNPAESQSHIVDPSDMFEDAPAAELDRAVLNILTNKALEPNVLFGRGLELTDGDREQLNLVAADAEAALNPCTQTPTGVLLRAWLKRVQTRAYFCHL